MQFVLPRGDSCIARRPAGQGAPRLEPKEGRGCIMTDPLATKPLVLDEVVDQVAILTLNNPGRRNALSRETLQTLRAHLERAAADPGIRAVIIRAVGPAFSAGH